MWNAHKSRRMDNFLKYCKLTEFERSWARRGLHCHNPALCHMMIFGIFSEIVKIILCVIVSAASFPKLALNSQPILTHCHTFSLHFDAGLELESHVHSICHPYLFQRISDSNAGWHEEVMKTKWREWLRKSSILNIFLACILCSW